MATNTPYVVELLERLTFGHYNEGDSNTDMSNGDIFYKARFVWVRRHVNADGSICYTLIYRPNKHVL